MNKADQAVMQAHREDLAQEREDLRAELAEERRRQWAQSHGNDSGYDPQPYIETTGAHSMNTETPTAAEISRRMKGLGLVRGFSLIEYKHTPTQSKTIETLFYVDFDGVTVYASEPRPFSHSFEIKNEKWHQVEAIPAAAEFIGNYRKA
jgi:hypothetical protein